MYTDTRETILFSGPVGCGKSYRAVQRAYELKAKHILLVSDAPRGIILHMDRLRNGAWDPTVMHVMQLNYTEYCKLIEGALPMDSYPSEVDLVIIDEVCIDARETLDMAFLLGSIFECTVIATAQVNRAACQSS